MIGAVERIMRAARNAADQRLLASKGNAMQEDVHMAHADLHDIITAALADARQDGAQSMREAIAHQAEINALCGVHGITVSTIRTLPLPTPSVAHPRNGRAEPVRLSYEQIEAISRETDDIEVDSDGAIEYARAIENAALAANGLGGGNA